MQLDLDRWTRLVRELDVLGAHSRGLGHAVIDAYNTGQDRHREFELTKDSSPVKFGPRPPEGTTLSNLNLSQPPADELRPGDFVAEDGTKARAPGEIAVISLNYYKACEAPMDIFIVARHAEVSGAMPLYKGMAPSAVNARLAADPHHIIVSAAKPPSGVTFSWGTPGQPADIRSGIPCATRPTPPTPPTGSTNSDCGGFWDAGHSTWQ